MPEDLIVVIPGIMGTTLKRGRVNVWDTSVSAVAGDLLRFADFVEQLRLPAGIGDEAPDPRVDGLTVGPLIKGWHVWPGKWIGAGYLDFTTWLRRQYPTPGRVLEFPYDWRLSVRYTAGCLKTFIQAAVARWRRQTGRAGARAVLVCHSMGGLVARHYVNALGDEGMVSRIITLGTPYAGSVNAARSMAGGSPLIPSSLVQTMRTFPALHHLLPTFRCVRGPEGMAAVGPEGIPGVDGSMFADALRLRTEGKQQPDAARPHVVVGHRNATLTGIEVVPGDPDRLAFHDTWLGERAGGSADQDFRGDGTVPRFCALPSDWHDEGDACFVAARHSRLVNDKRARNRVIEVIDGLDPREFLAGHEEFGLDLPDVVVAREPFTIHVRAELPHLRLSLAVRDLDERPVPGMCGAPVCSDGGGAYHAELALPAGAWKVEVVLAGQPPVIEGDVVLAVAA